MSYSTQYPILEFYLNQLYTDEQLEPYASHDAWQTVVRDQRHTIAKVGWIRELRRDLKRVSAEEFNALASVCLGWVIAREESDWLLRLLQTEWGHIRA